MKILITNDDGTNAPGLESLVKILRPYGDLTIVPPKYHQSGMGMAINLGYKPMAFKQISNAPHERRYYLDGTPASCVKFAIDRIYYPDKPDVVVSGINNGLNAATCAIYSGTVGAANEASLSRIPSIAVSLDHFGPGPDFSAVEALFPQIFEKIMANAKEKYGLIYNINFPDVPASEIKGFRVSRLGRMHWENEFQEFDPAIYDKLGVKPLDLGVMWLPEVEPGEEVYMMAGDMLNEPDTPEYSDQIFLQHNYVSITPQSLDNTDLEEMQRLKDLKFDIDL